MVRGRPSALWLEKRWWKLACLPDRTGRAACPTALLHRRRARAWAFVCAGGAAVVIAIGLAAAPARLVMLGSGQGRTVSFLSWMRVSYGRQSVTLDAADFNGDGYDDLAVDDTGALVLLLNDGQGGWSPPRRFPGGHNGLSQLIARDVNDDGRADVAACYADGALWSFLGDGMGNLAEGTQFVVGGAPKSLAAADFDGDGHLDVAVALFGGSVSGYVQLMRNDGAGNFSAFGEAVPIGRVPVQVTSGDFDGDGHPDVAASNLYDRTVTVLFGDGQGGFADRLTLTTLEPAGGEAEQGVEPPLPAGVTAGDLNGDGVDDLVVANGVMLFSSPGASEGALERNESPYGFGNVILFVSTGRRAFAPGLFLPADNFARAARILDVNGDGRPDVVVGGWLGVLTLLARGDGSFERRGSTGTDLTITLALTSGDFNGDGRPDAAISGNWSWVDVFINQGGGEFASWYFFLRTEAAAYVQLSGDAAAADLNGDGIVDLVTETGPTIVSFLGMGDGQFSRPIASAASQNTSGVTLAEFTGDGDLDAAVQTFDRRLGRQVLDLFRGDGHGHFELASGIADEAEYGQVAVADFDEDGGPDLAAIAYRYDRNIAGVDVLLSEGGGQFRPPLTLAAGHPLRVLVGDLDRDGHTDIVLLNGGMEPLSVFLGRGDGTFADEITVAPFVQAHINSGRLGDFDEDGFPDLAVTVGGDYWHPMGPFWLRGDGHGHFTNPIHLVPQHVGLITQGDFSGQVAVADFNGDGHADIAVAQDGGVTVFEGDGKGGFAGGRRGFALGTTTDRELVAADFNGDGLPDLTTPTEGFAGTVKLTMLFNTTPPRNIVAGDADCDETVSAQDLAALTRRLFSFLYRLACSGADANGDGALSAADVTATAQRLQ